MKPFAYIVYDQQNNTRLHYTKESAKKDALHIGSKLPIHELYLKASHCNKEAYDAGYFDAQKENQEVINALGNALNDLCMEFGECNLTENARNALNMYYYK